MLKRLISLLLVMVLLSTAAVPAALAEDLSIDPEISIFNDEYTLEMSPGETDISIGFSDGTFEASYDVLRCTFLQHPQPDTPSIATCEFVPDKEGFKDYLYVKVSAHSPGETTIKGTIFLECLPWEDAPSYELSIIHNLTIHVNVKEELKPPKVEVRLVPGNTTKLVTAYPEWVDALDDALGLWGVGDLIDLVMAFTGVGAAAEVARDRIISWLIFDQLHAIRKPDVSPDIQLDVSVYNPNDVSLKYQVTLSSAADFSNSTTFASGGVDTYAEYMQPAATAGTGPLSTSAYASLSLAPGWTRIHHFKLKPHMLYGGGEYTVPFTMLIPWSENDPDVAFGSRGGIQEDFDIHVVSELDEEHTYQGKEVYKDLITRVKNAIEFIMKYNPVKISIQQQLPVPL